MMKWFGYAVIVVVAIVFCLVTGLFIAHLAPWYP